MSEEIPKLEDLEGLEGKDRIGKLKQLIEAGIDPTTVNKNKDDIDKIGNNIPPKTTELTDKDKIMNQDNFDKLIKLYEDQNTSMVKKEVDQQRGVILTEIKEFDEQSYNEEKDNYSINELNKVLSTLKRTLTKDDSKRDVGGVPKDKKTEAPNTQYDHFKGEFAPG